MASRFLVGIDLGTTNTVVAYADARDAVPTVRVLQVEQLVGLGEVAARPSLPSLRYHPAPGELNPADVRLPWPVLDPGGVDSAVVGTLARELGTLVPGRLVSSAKSWLSHAAADRTAPILPWGAADDVPKVSPLAASASYLAYVRAAWNRQFAEAPLEQQDVVLTVPASFDEAARALTVEAAREAGLPGVRLLEEPQAAFYDWLFHHRDRLKESLGDIRLALVCDVGGGTTDLTLIQVRTGEREPQLARVGVGDHLMLGGDNMDLGLARLLEGRMAAGSLGTGRFAQLVQQCRTAKETLLSDPHLEGVTVTVLGGGARLVGGALSAELRREEVTRLVLDGFLPQVAADARPQRLRGGIVEFGLPYAADPAITRHVADFLANHQTACRAALGDRAPAPEELAVPDAVLLNGGVFRSPALGQRLLQVLGRWRGGEPRQLHNDAPDLAVARGAVAYGLARRGTGTRIGGGSARNYFLVLGGGEPRQGVCLLPRGAEEGRDVALSGRNFALRVGQPVGFHLVSSTGDRACEPGELQTLSGEGFHPLPPLATVLHGDEGPEVPVTLVSSLTEVGTLEVYCVGAPPTARRWRLEFQLRGGATPAAALGAQVHPRFADAAQLIDAVYGGRSQKVDPKAVKRLRADLEKVLGPRDQWDTPLLRELFGALMSGMPRRRRSVAHERVWFNLAGFCIRPGFGYPLDDWRIGQLWSICEQGVQFVPESQVWSEWWILWRRTAGGLDEDAQTRILDQLAYYLQPPGKALVKRPAGPKAQGYDDMVRLAGSLENLPVARKAEVGQWLLERLRKPSENPQTWWAVGRLGSRVPFHGSVHKVLPSATASQWLEEALCADWKKSEPAAFAATLLARVSGDRQRDLAAHVRAAVADKLRSVKAPPAWAHMVLERVELDEADERRVFGESLPPGLKLI